MDVAQIDDRLARRNARVLACAQAIGGGAAPINFGMGGLAGDYLLQLADGPRWLATVPVTCFVIGMALAASPANLLMRHTGRRFVYRLGAVAIIACGLLAAAAIVLQSFIGLCLALVLGGAAQAISQSYRFAAADTASPAFVPKAIAWVMAGGVLGGVIGPQTMIHTKDLFEPILFAGAFVGEAILGVVLFVVVSFVRLPIPRFAPELGTGRPLSVIARQPAYLVAAGCATAAFALMNLVMTAAPLAMVACGLTQTDAALGMQWHVIAMFAPSFVAGSLMQRYGARRVVAAGMVFLAASGVVALSGLTVWHFWVALVLLGIGWNFGYGGGTALLTETYRPEERAKAQALNEQLVFTGVVLASLSSGGLLQAAGWAIINWMIFPVAALCVALLAWQARVRLRPAVA